MKIYSAEQIYEADKITIARQGITSDALMERAAAQLFNWMHARLQGAPVKIHLFCGIGNNGGDGLALARHLQEHGYDIVVYVVNFSKNRSTDFLTNIDRLKARKIWPDYLDADSGFPLIDKEDIVVDAIFGIGLNRSPDTWVSELIDYLNASGAFLLSVDIPSGLFSDSVPKTAKGIVKANYVLSFQAPKLVFFLPAFGEYVEQWDVLDIGLDPGFLSETATDFELIGKQEILPIYKPRKKFDHKGHNGHVLIIGGSYGKIGAVHLAAKASLKTGSGLVTAYVPECGMVPLQANLPEAMVITDIAKKYISKLEFNITPTVIGIGVGMGTEEATQFTFAEFLRSNTTPLVIDADGLNMLAQNKALLKYLPKNSVLTPHGKELERLIGKWEDDFEKLKKARSFSLQHRCVLVIKGAHTIILHNGKGYINTTGNPGMATAGSGDVLTGMIASLLGQGYAVLDAAIFGVYLHGKAGDITAMANSYQALTATGIVETIGSAYLDLFSHQDAPSGNGGTETH